MPPARVSRRPTHVPTLDDQPSVLPPDARRRYLHRPEEKQESRTLADLNVIYWLKRFPHWKMVATIVEDEPVEELEKVHRTVAVVHKGMKDGSAKLDRYINVKKKQPSWNTLVYGAPRPYDKRYPETMPQK